MCFSATASFTAAGILGCAAVYTYLCVYRKRHSEHFWIYFLLGIFPTFYAVQQAGEGIAWLGLMHENDFYTQLGSHIFYFFAYCFWVSYIPFFAFYCEPSQNTYRKKILFGCFMIGVLTTLYMLSLIFFSSSPLKVEVVEHSLRYGIQGSMDYYLLKIGYIAGFFSCFFSSHRWIQFFGFMGLLFAAVAHVFFTYTRTSVWCFFSAIFSIYVIYIIQRKKGIR